MLFPMHKSPALVHLHQIDVPPPHVESAQFKITPQKVDWRCLVVLYGQVRGVCGGVGGCSPLGCFVTPVLLECL